MIRVETVGDAQWNSLVELFSESPECSECWCMNHRSDPKNCPTGNLAKDALRSSLMNGHAHGLLAFVNDKPAGWCAIDPVKTQIGHDFTLQNPSASGTGNWMIHCLYVAPKFRGMGVSQELIKMAIKLAEINGAQEVLAFPIPEDSAGKFPKDVAEFSGRFSTFKKFGFEEQKRLDDFYQVVSKVL